MRAITPWGHGATVGFGLQVLGLGIDGGWHATHPDGEMAPFWAHLPIHAGIAVLAVAVVLARRGPRAMPLVALVTAGVALQVVGDAWSLAVNAEANDFFVPAILIGLGGAVAFVGVIWSPGRRWIARSRARATTSPA